MRERQRQSMVGEHEKEKQTPCWGSSGCFFYYSVICLCMNSCNLCIHFSVAGHWVGSSLRLFIKKAIVIILAQVCMGMLLFILDKCPGIELLDHIVNVYLTVYENAKQFPKWLSQFSFSLTMYECPICSTFSLTLVVLIFLTVCILVIIKWHLTGILISLMMNNI